MSGNEILEIQASGKKDYTQKREITALDYLDEALALFKSGEYTAIFKLCEKAISVNPRLPKTYRVLALAYYHTGDLDNAERYWEKAWQMRLHIYSEK